ncbi:hypothetical protein KI387_020686, partial [Taxus chinensis]
MNIGGDTASFTVEERYSDKGRHEERGKDNSHDKMRERGARLVFTDGFKVNLMSDDIVIARGVFCDSSTHAVCHGMRLALFTIKFVISEAIVPTTPLPYPMTFAGTLAECVKGFVIWDVKDIKLDTLCKEA